MTDKSLNCLYYLHPQIKDTVDENNELLEEKKELIIQLIKVKKELSEQKKENQKLRDIRRSGKKARRVIWCLEDYIKDELFGGDSSFNIDDIMKKIHSIKNENQEQYEELELLKKKYNMAKSVIKNLRNK